MEQVTYMTPRGKAWMNGTMKSQMRVAERMRNGLVCKCNVYSAYLHNQDCHYYLPKGKYDV
jgi:hypothetical protein